MSQSMLLTIVFCVLIHAVNCKEHWGAFKFVGGFLGFDDERTSQSSTLNPGLSVIGAGFARTGTKSMETALIKLGHKIYDTRSMLELKHADLWVEAAVRINEAADSSLAEQLLQDIESMGYTATLDYPMNLFAETFAALRPEAKVLFTTRDTDDWFRSWHNVNVILGAFILRPWSLIVDFTFVGKISSAYDFTFIYPSFPDHIQRPLPWFETCDSFPMFDGHDSKDRWVSFYNQFRQKLEDTLPSSRFIAFDVRQGWGPLLNFLEIDNPKLTDEPFPHVNDINSLKIVRRVMDIVGIGLPLWIVLMVALFSFLIRYAFRKAAFFRRRAVVKSKRE